MNKLLTALLGLVSAITIGLLATLSLGAIHARAATYSTQVDTADLAVTKTASAPAVTVGDQLTYTITVTNHGPANASQVVMTDDLPHALIYAIATPSQGDCFIMSSTTARVVTCRLGNLAVGGTATVQIVATVEVEGSLVNTATVDGLQTDPTVDNNTAVAVVSAKPAATTVPTPTAAGLPGTGGRPGTDASVPWSLLTTGALLLAALPFGVVAARRTRS